jgi:FkbM family methyltransferase
MKPLRKLQSFLRRSHSKPVVPVVDPDVILGANAVAATRQGLRWLLYSDRYLDQEILKWGYFEKETTEIYLKFLRPDMVVFDVGANFGYYTALTAAKLNDQGHVHAFEPTLNYRQRLMGNLIANRLESRVTVHPVALSNQIGEADIRIGNSSATMHPVGDYGTVETIALRTLDDFVREKNIDRIDMIKVDIDGHEPLFVAGSFKTLARFRPCLLIEISEQHLVQHGSSAMQQRSQLEEIGYVLFSEKTGKPFQTTSEFVQECSNPLLSSNVWCFAKENAPTALF